MFCVEFFASIQEMDGAQDDTDGVRGAREELVEAKGVRVLIEPGALLTIAGNKARPAKPASIASGSAVTRVKKVVPRIPTIVYMIPQTTPAVYRFVLSG